MDILLLHGAIGAASQLTELSEIFADTYQVHTLDFTGHGGSRPGDKAFSIELFANDVLNYINSRSLKTVTIFGYSMGGYVAMYLALHHPDRVDKIITLATKYNWDETIATKETQMLNPDKIAQKLTAFAETLQQRHAPADWKDVLNRTAQMMVQMGADNPIKAADYPSISHPTLLLLGDRDKMVTLDETLAVYKALPNGQLCLLPNTSHPIEQINKQLLYTLVCNFLKG